MITVTLACLMAFFFSSLKKTRTIPFCCPLWVCFSGPIWDTGSCAEQQICFSQTQLALGAKKIIPLFTGWATASVLLLLSGCSTILDRKTSCHTAISRKRRLWTLSAYGASYFKNSALTLQVQGGSQRILRQRRKSKERAGKLSYCEEESDEGPHPAVGNAVFENLLPVFTKRPFCESWKVFRIKNNNNNNKNLGLWI